LALGARVMSDATFGAGYKLINCRAIGSIRFGGITLPGNGWPV
jgi:hypothetical protein